MYNTMLKRDKAYLTCIFSNVSQNFPFSCLHTRIAVRDSLQQAAEESFGFETNVSELFECHLLLYVKGICN